MKKETLKPAKKETAKEAARGAREKQPLLFGQNIIAALDIGSSKICCFIAELKSHGTIEVIGIGHQASKGVRAGTIVDLRAAEEAVALAVEAAETMARGRLDGHPIKSVFVNVPGVHTLSHRLGVDVKISGHEITRRDIDNALAMGRRVAVPGKDEIIHTIAAAFSIDGQRGIEEPCGMSGQNLNASIIAVTGLSPAMRNLATVAGQNHLETDGYCAAPYASGLSVLSADEMNLGCTVIDMGGGTTSIAVFAEGGLVFSAGIPVGGQHVTSDIARGLTTSLADAERIKTLYGSAQALGLDDASVIDVPPVGEEEHAHPNYVPRSLLTGIIQPRIEETFELVRARLVDSGIGHTAGRRVVLTGGASQLPGLCDIGQLILDKQIRLGRPQRVRGLAESTGGPAFATAAGLLHYAAEHADEMPTANAGRNFVLPTIFSSPIPGNLVQKVTLWLKENW